MRKGTTQLVTVLASISMAATALSCKVNRPEPSIDFETAKAAYEKRDYVTALKGFRPLANRGNADALLVIGKIYENGGVFESDGLFVKPNYEKALQSYRSSAQKGNVEAEKSLGDLYISGYRLPENDVEAMKWYSLASKHGNGEATWRLGDGYYRGEGVKADRCEGVRLGVLSAKQGNVLGLMLAEGAYNPKEPQPKESGELLKWLTCGVDNGVAPALVVLGAKYYDGDGVRRNYAEALRLFTLAAKQEGEWAKSDVSVHLAQSFLGDMYNSGTGVAVDHNESVKWFRLAADGNDADAQFKLGRAYASGLGVPQDYSEAIRYFRMAAEQGHSHSQGALGAAYLIGRGVPQDYVQAHLWLNLASVDGDQELLKLRDATEQKMMPTQLALAQRLAKEWKAKTENK